MVGQLNAGNFPLQNALQPAFGGGGFDGFVVKIDTDQAAQGKSKSSLWSSTETGFLTDNDGAELAFNPFEILQLTVDPDGAYRHGIYFDGTDVGLDNPTEGAEIIDAFTVLPDGSILISTAGYFAVPGPDDTIYGGPQDLLLFTPATLGETTEGTWSLYFRGEPVGLDLDNNIDALSVLPDGTLIMSTSGLLPLSDDVVASDQDLVAFTATSLGEMTEGTWAPYLDGSAIGLTQPDEGIDAVFVDWTAHAGAPQIYLSTRGNFEVQGLSGTGDDVFVFHASQLGATTSGFVSSQLAVRADLVDMTGRNVRGYRDEISHAEPRLNVGGPGALGNFFVSSYLEGGLAALVVSPQLSLAEPDDAQLDTALAWINGRLDGSSETLEVDTTGTSIVANFDGARGVLTLSGVDSLAHYRQVLATLRYQNVADRPTGNAREIGLALGGDGNASLPSFVSVMLEPSNDAPTVDLNGPLAPGFDRQVMFAPGSGPLTLPDSAMTVADPDAGLLTTAIYVVDPSSTSGPAIIRVSPVDGAQEIVSTGGLLVEPVSILVAPDGDLLVADACSQGAGAILRIGQDGTQELLASGADLIHPRALAMATDGALYVAAEATIGADTLGVVVRVDPTTGAQELLSAGQWLGAVHGIVVDQLGQIVVTADLTTGEAGVLRIDATTGVQSLVSAGGLLVQPVGICVGSSGNYFVADADANGGSGAIIRVLVVNGEQVLVAAGGYFDDPIGVSFAGDNDLLVLDAGLVDESYGALLCIDHDTLEQSLVSGDNLLFAPEAMAPANIAVVSGAIASLTGITDPLLESLAVDTLGTPIEGHYDPLSGVLSLTGTATLNQYRQVLATLRFDHAGSGAVSGSRFVQVFVSDGLTDSLPANVQIDIEPPPTADAGGPYTVIEGRNARLSGAASQGEITSYAWDLDNDGTFETPGRDVRFHALDDGFYTVGLQVTGPGGSSIGTTTVDVLNVAPTASIAGPASAAPGVLQTFTLLAKDYTSVDQSAGFSFVIDWGDGSTPQMVTGLSGMQVTHAFDSIGRHTVRVSATDKDDGTSLLSNQEFFVSGVQLVPSAQNPALTDLLWTGSGGEDHVRFEQLDATTIRVRTLRENGVTTDIAQVFGDVTGRVIALADGGNDVLDASLLTTTAATLDGGTGSNTLYGGAENDTLIGGAKFAATVNGPEGQQGNNVLVGGAGDDTIYGNAINGAEGKGGNNLLLGGAGNDTIYGNWNDGGEGGGRNIIVGGADIDTLYDYTVADGAEGKGSILIAGDTSLSVGELNTVMSEWKSTRSYTDRVDNLLGVGSGPRNNGNIFLQAGSTVVNDAAVDQLWGSTGGGFNWFWYVLAVDEINRAKAEEAHTTF